MKRINVFSIKQVKEKGGLYDVGNYVACSPEDSYNIIEAVLDLSSEAVEKFGILTLTTKNTIAGVHVLHTGDINTSVVSIRSIFQACLLNNAASFICFHNHPSGNPKPSLEDLQITYKIREAGQLMGIKLLDHIIIGDEDRKYISLKENRDI